ncbi:hypothetical protein BDB01DRAFT_831866 [Pilobolus umbonatus]|nr:hypothetical protein BDB01DRAFT_831866 [Pilobolus umbonatus]
MNWNYYIGRQCAIEEACNILINGGKSITGTNTSYRRRAHKSHFNEGDTAQMPLVVFGDGLKGRAHERFRKKRVGVSEMIYRHLQKRERQGQLLLIDINEFRTSPRHIERGCFPPPGEKFKDTTGDEAYIEAAIKGKYTAADENTS